MMYHAFWFDGDGVAHHTQTDTIDELVKELGGFAAAKVIFESQYQPAMCTGAILLQGQDLLWNYDEDGNVPEKPVFDDDLPDPDWEPEK